LCDVNGTLRYKRIFKDTYILNIDNVWNDLGSGSQTEDRLYVVQTISKAIERCILMTTDPGDLVLDPTCGSGTTATVAEQWGRCWITIDTSRVALALARARIMGARYPYYLLADTREGQEKEAEITCTAPSSQPVRGNIRHGFVYDRVPHITLKSIANNTEIDVIWDKWQNQLEPLREALHTALKKTWQEWEIPREAEAKWSDETKQLHADWWQARIARQKEIDASIAAKAEFEYLYDKPYTDPKKVRVAGPFTVESLSPHRVLGVNEHDELIDPAAKPDGHSEKQTFPQMILENLKPPGCSKPTKKTKSPSPPSPLGPEISSVPTDAIPKATKPQALKNEPQFSSAQNLAPSSVPTSSQPPEKPEMPTLTCSSPVPLTMKPTPQNSVNWHCSVNP
jgi:adenine-specific DNA-methyltransferase